jgi:hypothetical protein
MISTSDVNDFLVSLGVTPSSTYDLAAEVKSVKLEFSARTGRPYFFYERVGPGPVFPESLTYDPPDTRAGTCRLYVDDFLNVSAVIVDGETYESGVDYWLIRWAARLWVDLTPVVAIDFVRDPGRKRQSIMVVGDLGWTTAFPDDVKQAVIKEAARRYLVGHGGATGSIASEKMGERSIAYSVEAGRSVNDRWRAEFLAQTQIYRKVIP